MRKINTEALHKGTTTLAEAANKTSSSTLGRQVKANLRVMFPHSADPAADFTHNTRRDPGFESTDSTSQRRQKIEAWDSCAQSEGLR